MSNDDDNANSAKKRKAYSVGYGKPPAQHQWKKGQSGNPDGRPKGRKSLAQFVRDEGHEEASYKDGDIVKTTLKAVLVSKTLHQKAMKGDLKAIELLFMIDRSIQNDDVPKPSEDLPAEDRAILARATARRGWTVEDQPVADWSPPSPGELRCTIFTDGSLTFDLMPFDEVAAAELVAAVDAWIEGQADGFEVDDLSDFIFVWIKRQWAPPAPPRELHRLAIRETVTNILTKGDGTVIISHAGDLA
jgi:hypothetical protein